MKSKIYALSFCLFIQLFLVQLFSIECPEWMLKQINNDLARFKNRKISQEKMVRYFKSHCNDFHLQLIKFTILNNEISCEHGAVSDSFISRKDCFLEALTSLSKQIKLPDVCFYISMHDDLCGFNNKRNFPFFSQAKLKNDALILVPDYEAIKARYQVMSNSDITAEEIPWSHKREQLIWRGSSAQKCFDNSHIIQKSNIDKFSRVKLCQLSLQDPSLIDAKFTLLWQVEEPSLLETYAGEFVSYEQQGLHKYHIMIDGNSCTFSNSGWKFFLNSLIYMPDSPRIQWYYNELVPLVHYVPVNADLSDLVDKINWAMDNDVAAETIAHNAREFALTHLTLDQSLLYWYFLLLEYSKLNFIK